MKPEDRVIIWQQTRVIEHKTTGGASGRSSLVRFLFAV